MADTPFTTIEGHFLIRTPPSYLSKPLLIRLRRRIEEAEAASSGFADRLRQTALLAIASDDERLIRQGLQCLAIVGRPEDAAAIHDLAVDAGPDVRRDLKTCLFEIQHGSR